MHKVSLSLDPSRLDIDAIHAFLLQSYWSPGQCSTPCLPMRMFRVCAA
jgi:hypothetical protein